MSRLSRWFTGENVRASRLIELEVEEFEKHLFLCYILSECLVVASRLFLSHPQVMQT